MANITTGNALIDFDLPTSEGQTCNGYQYLKGATALILVFTTGHCSYVQAWEARINALARDYAPRDVRMLAIDPGETASYPPNSPDSMVGPVSQMEYIFPYLFDERREVARAYGAQVTPEVFLFDAVGILRYHGAVDDNDADENAVTISYLQKALQQYLDGGTITMPESQPVGCPIEWKS
ncbi:MAG: redoxin domain-containing protein [Ktedonobacteraceae bacterium]